ncbi:uncharacterized protein NEMAJ01_2205, partial [Nematocida major]|uniref:uncharacterized protein n=1 Tax=Nematocida major TaxID=1912982 RepID=UPI0020074403
MKDHQSKSSSCNKYSHSPGEMHSDSAFRAFLSEVQDANAQINEAGKIYAAFSGGSDTGEDLRLSEEFRRTMESAEEKISGLARLQENRSTRQRQIHVQSLLERSQALLKAFSSEQQKKLQKEAARMREKYLVAKPAASEEELSALSDEASSKALIAEAYKLGGSQKTVQEAEERSEKI